MDFFTWSETFKLAILFIVGGGMIAVMIGMISLIFAVMTAALVFGAVLWKGIIANSKSPQALADKATQAARDGEDFDDI